MSINSIEYIELVDKIIVTAKASRKRTHQRECAFIQYITIYRVIGQKVCVTNPNKLENL